MGNLKKKIVAIDESNHGRFPEYFVAVFSNIINDLIEEKQMLTKNYPKSKKASWKIVNKLQRRKYTFLDAQEDDYERISPRRFPGVVIGSLMQKDVDIYEVDELTIMLDGEWKRSQNLFIKEYVSEIIGLSRDSISLITGKNLDCRYKVVNLADRLAHTLFRWGGSPEKISSMPQRRTFLE